SCDQRFFANPADWNFAARDQLIEFRAPDCRHPTTLRDRIEQLIHVRLATVGQDGPGDRARVVAGSGEYDGQPWAEKRAAINAQRWFSCGGPHEKTSPT